MLLPRPKTGTAPALLQGAAAAKRGVISRDTVAAVCMAALRTPAAAGATFTVLEKAVPPGAQSSAASAFAKAGLRPDSELPPDAPAEQQQEQQQEQPQQQEQDKETQAEKKAEKTAEPKADPKADPKKPEVEKPTESAQLRRRAPGGPSAARDPESDDSEDEEDSEDESERLREEEEQVALRKRAEGELVSTRVGLVPACLGSLVTSLVAEQAKPGLLPDLTDLA